MSSYGLEFRFVEHSKIILNRVILNVDTEPGLTFQFNDYSKADICNFTFSGAYNLGFSDYSEASIANSTIFYLGPAKTAHIQVSNSSILILELWFTEGEVVEVNGLKSGFLEYLDLKEKISSSYHAFDLTLNKTSIDQK